MTANQNRVFKDPAPAAAALSHGPWKSEHDGDDATEQPGHACDIAAAKAIAAADGNGPWRHPDSGAVARTSARGTRDGRAGGRARLGFDPSRNPPILPATFAAAEPIAVPQDVHRQHEQ